MNPKILYIGPLKDFSGYATAARDYVNALDSVGANLVTRALTYDGGNHKYSDRENELANRDLQNVEIVIQHTTPNETEFKPGLFNVNYFAWETDRVPSEWADKINQMHLALVPCEENIRAARLGGVRIPIEKIEHTFNLNKYKKTNLFNIPGSDGKFKILAVCQLSKKKGVDALLKAFFSEFKNRDNVILILKTYIGPNDTAEQRDIIIDQINKAKESLRLDNYPPVYLIHGVASEDAIIKLYNSVDAYCLPSRGEGWGIPAFDAMGFGLPPIVVGWGGPTEFVDSSCGWLTDYSLSPCNDMPHPHSFMYTAKDNWAEPDINSLRKALRSSYLEWSINKSAWNARVLACKEKVKMFTYPIIGNKMNNTILKYYNRWKVNG